MKRGAALRAFYACLACANAGLVDPDPRLLDAFASVRRERFLAPGPWQVFTNAGYVDTPGDHPSVLYQDVLVALDASRWLNTGRPSLHARALAALAPAPGDDVVHVGAGGGYYTALLAELVGPAGTVRAFEIDPALARLARANLRGYRRVELVHGGAADAALGEIDRIYVNAGLSHPPRAWLEALRPGGALCAPVTGSDGRGYLVRLGRAAPDAFSISVPGPVRFVPCEGVRDEALGDRLIAALDSGELAEVRSLRTGAPDGSCVFDTPHWWLSSSAAPAP